MNEILSYTEKQLKNYDGSHDIFHAIQVAFNVCKIAKEEVRLSVFAALLHDTCDPKYVNKEHRLKETRHFLLKHLRESEIEDVLDAINNTSYSKLKREGVPKLKTSRSRKIWRNIADADMLEAMGVTGVIRTLMYQGFKEKNLGQALTYMNDELTDCEKYIKNEVAKKEARDRKNTMEQFLANMYKKEVKKIAETFMIEGSQKSSFLKVLQKHSQDIKSIPWLHSKLEEEIFFFNKTVLFYKF
tara:strand:- start:858 stop:1586 length:729 start_codon:yes stop_codon:yes gene_type:complete